MPHKHKNIFKSRWISTWLKFHWPIDMELVVQFQRGVRLKCYYAFLLVCCGCDTLYIVSLHVQCQAFIYTLSLCSGHSWRVRLSKQKTLTPPGQLVSPLVYRGPWISTVVLYCRCHSDSASVLLYFTLLQILTTCVIISSLSRMFNDYYFPMYCIAVF